MKFVILFISCSIKKNQDEDFGSQDLVLPPYETLSWKYRSGKANNLNELFSFPFPGPLLVEEFSARTESIFITGQNTKNHFMYIFLEEDQAIC